MKKLAIITGAGSGIGQATALKFNLMSWDIFLIGRDIKKLKDTESLCTNSNSSIYLQPCDLAQEKQLDEVSLQINKLKPDQVAIINNAGIFQSHKFVDGGIKTWVDQFQVNLFGAVSLVQKLLPTLSVHGNHSIVNVSSTLGLKPTAETSAYSASKAAMINWTQSLALALASQNIRVNCVCPGLVDTPIHSFHNLGPAKKAEAMNQMKSLQPLGRIGKADEIAQAIYFLASTDSSWTTGAILAVDGGINLL